jgi:homeodomain interacting protein kinase
LQVDRREFIDLLKRMLTMDQERRITPSEALNHPFVTMAHMADYAHCANVKSSALKMEICKRSPGGGGVATPSAATAAATLMAAGGLRSGNVTLTFNNQLGGVGRGVGGATAAQVVNGLAVRERTAAAYDAHFQVRSCEPLLKSVAFDESFLPVLRIGSLIWICA